MSHPATLHNNIIHESLTIMENNHRQITVISLDKLVSFFSLNDQQNEMQQALKILTILHFDTC